MNPYLTKSLTFTSVVKYSDMKSLLSTPHGFIFSPNLSVSYRFGLVVSLHGLYFKYYANDALLYQGA